MLYKSIIIYSICKSSAVQDIIIVAIISEISQGTHVTYLNSIFHPGFVFWQSYFEETIDIVHANRGGERKSSRTGNQRTPTRGLDRRNIWRLASESTVSLGRPPIGEFSRISFLRRPSRKFRAQVTAPGTTEHRYISRPRFLAGRKESAPLSLISRCLLALAYPITNVSGRLIISSSSNLGLFGARSSVVDLLKSSRDEGYVPLR